MPSGNGKSVWSAFLVAWTLAFTAVYPAARSASTLEACPAGDDPCLAHAATGRASVATDRTAHADFNADGISDLAVGVALEDVGEVIDAGAINVLYGTPTGLTAGGNQFITQDSAFVKDVAEAGEQLGRYNGTGDFNGDGFADLAIGVPLEDVGDVPDAGAVNVIYGSVTGLTNVGNQFITQSGLNPLDDAEENDWFGGRIQGGDFNGDGYDDLAVGTYLEDVAPGEGGGEQLQNAGAVNVLYGSGRGLLGRGSQSGPRTPQGSWRTSTQETSLGGPWPREISTPTASRTSPSARGERTSAGRRTRERSTSCTGPWPGCPRRGTSCGPRTGRAS